MTRDPEAVARKILADFDRDGPIHGRDLTSAIANALRSYRDAALEEAAKLADAIANGDDAMPEDYAIGHNIAHAIRSLQSKAR